MPPARFAKPSLTMSPTDWLLLVVLSLLWDGSIYFARPGFSPARHRDRPCARAH
jgi:hypothetical protein